MTLSTLVNNTMDDPGNSKKPDEYKYDVKLEVGEQPGGGTVPIVAIFHDLVKRMKEVVDDDKPLVVLTATDKLYFEHKEITSDEFKKAFKVDQSDGKASKVFLGFKLHTMTKLYDIKQRLMKSYLVPHNLFLREHVGGFHNGLKTYMYGFLKNDHPDHPDSSTLNQRFARILLEAWKKLDKAERTKWKKEIPEAFYADGVAIPFTFSKERIAAASDGKPKITTYAVVVATPKKFGQLLRTLLDIAILAKKITNLIPFAFQREDQTGFYHLVADQARFMEQHRNIPISNVPYDMVNHRGAQGKTLEAVLNGHQHIHRVAFDHKNAKYHVSTNALKYREVHEWIATILEEHRFPFAPTITPMKFTGNKGSGVKYAAIFADVVSVANESYDASTIKTNRSPAWKPRPPMDISYIPSAEAFPPLQKKADSIPVTQSTTSETLDEDTIQSAISMAIKTLQKQHQADLDQLKQEMNDKMAAMERQMKNLATTVATQTYQALVTDESPLATKKDHAHLQSDMEMINTQLSTLINMITNGTGIALSPTTTQVARNTSPPRTGKRHKQSLTPEKSGLFGDPSPQASTDSSAASDLDEGMEGCDN